MGCIGDGETKDFGLYMHARILYSDRSWEII